MFRACKRYDDRDSRRSDRFSSSECLWFAYPSVSSGSEPTTWEGIWLKGIAAPITGAFLTPINQIRTHGAACYGFDLTILKVVEPILPSSVRNQGDWGNAFSSEVDDFGRGGVSEAFASVTTNGLQDER